MTLTTLQFTPEELKVLRALIEFHLGCDVPEWLNQESYDSVIDKVLEVCPSKNWHKGGSKDPSNAL
jgi:hypothetical protein